MFDLSPNQSNHGRLKIRGDSNNRLLLRGNHLQLSAIGNRGKQIQQIVDRSRSWHVKIALRWRREREWFSQDVLKFATSVESICIQGKVFAEPVVKDSAAAADNGLRRFRRISGAWRPRKTKARSKVVLAAYVALILVTQAITQSQIWTYAPIILSVNTKINLRDRGRKIAGVNTELGRAAAEFTDAVGSCTRTTERQLDSTQTVSLYQQRAPVAIETAQ